jgi:hypothetical protein
MLALSRRSRTMRCTTTRMCRRLWLGEIRCYSGDAMSWSPLRRRNPGHAQRLRMAVHPPLHLHAFLNTYTFHSVRFIRYPPSTARKHGAGWSFTGSLLFKCNHGYSQSSICSRDVLAHRAIPQCVPHSSLCELSAIAPAKALTRLPHFLCFTFILSYSRLFALEVLQHASS